MMSQQYPEVFDAFIKSLQELEADNNFQRINLAEEYGLPPESEWEDIANEGRRQAVLEIKALVEDFRRVSPKVAKKFEQCCETAITLNMYTTSKPENTIAKLAAATFIYHFQELQDECKHFILEVLPSINTINAEEAKRVTEMFERAQSIVWKWYKLYGSLQNQINNTGGASKVKAVY